MADKELIEAINQAFSRYVNGGKDMGFVTVGEYVLNQVFQRADMQDAGQIQGGRPCDRDGAPLYRMLTPSGSCPARETYRGVTSACIWPAGHDEPHRFPITVPPLTIADETVKRRGLLEDGGEG